MCLIFVALQQHPRFPLVIAANRDEFHQRPAAPADWWPDHPDVFGGRDLDKGGTWLAMRRDGAWAAITNVRSGRPDAAKLSRGQLALDFLATPQPAGQFFADAGRTFADCGGFNLLLADHEQVWHASNRHNRTPEPLPAGLYGLSNHQLDTPWPKVRAGKNALQQALSEHHHADALAAALAGLMANPETAPDHELPDTGVGITWERLLSAAFIKGQIYGTRATTVILADTAGNVRFQEWRFGPGGERQGESLARFQLTGRPAWLDS